MSSRRIVPTGPDRRQYIVEKAAELARARGLSSITMRAVAEAAGVPLGSMSYHFANKDELLFELVRFARAQTDAVTRGLLPELVATVGVAEAVASVVEALTRNDRDELIFEMDMYMLAMHDNRFAEESKEWSNLLVNHLKNYVDLNTARSIGYVVDGICTDAAVTGTVFTHQEIVGLIAPLLK